MHRQRMEHLRTVMIGVRAMNLPFEWATWFRPALPEEVEAVKSPTPWCHTAACVLGYAAFDPVFNEQGLRAEVQPLKGGSTFRITLDGKSDDKAYYSWLFRCATEFFDIDEPTADYLFTPDNDDADDCTDAEDVTEAIRRIENVLAGYRPIEFRTDDAEVSDAFWTLEALALEEKEEADAV